MGMMGEDYGGYGGMMGGGYGTGYGYNSPPYTTGTTNLQLHQLSIISQFIPSMFGGG